MGENHNRGESSGRLKENRRTYYVVLLLKTSLWSFPSWVLGIVTFTSFLGISRAKDHSRLGRAEFSFFFEEEEGSRGFRWWPLPLKRDTQKQQLLLQQPNPSDLKSGKETRRVPRALSCRVLTRRDKRSRQTTTPKEKT